MIQRKFRLLYFSSDRHPAKRVDVAVLFGRELAQRGHTIDFALQSELPCDVEQVAQLERCRVFVGPTDVGETRFGRLRKHLLSILHDFRVMWRARRGDYDFVQLKDKYVSTLFLIPMAKWKKIRFVYWLSFPFPEESLLKAKSEDAAYPVFYALRGHFFDFVFYRLVSRYADFIFVQSEQMMRDLAERGVARDKMLPVPMGVSQALLDQEMASGSGGGESTVLYMGTLARVRKMDFLIRAFRHVLDVVPNARLMLVGAGDDELDMEILRRESVAQGVGDSVVFTGWMKMDEALRHVRAAAVCVSPFYPTPILNSTSPTKLVEYMALGKPVVANDHPEQRLVIEESGAGLCVRYDEREFADAIVRLLGDPEGCLEMGRKGREYVRQYRIYGKIADPVEHRYLEILGPG